MTSKQYWRTMLKEVKKIPSITATKYQLKYKKGTHDFYRLQSAKIGKNEPVILLTAGIHGEEIAGPLAYLNNLKTIVDYIHLKGLKFICYPLLNPSGFEHRHRFNIDNDEADFGNNDFLRYELKNGQMTDDLKTKKAFKCWYKSTDKKLKLHLPKETLLISRLISKDLKLNIKAALDMHQDYLTKHEKPGAYHYCFLDGATYKKIVTKINKEVPVLTEHWIGAGYNFGKADDGTRNVKKLTTMHSDRFGFINRHDGSLTDWTYRMGVKHSLAVESMGVTPIEKAMRINLIWIAGLTDLVVEELDREAGLVKK